MLCRCLSLRAHLSQWSTSRRRSASCMDGGCFSTASSPLCTASLLSASTSRSSATFLPEDFVFRLSAAEIEVLNRSQNATASHKHRDPRFRPYAFTEHGAIMAAMVLNSQRATEISIYVVRAFVKLRGAARVLTTKSRPTAAHGSPVRPMSLSSLA
jgi:hypothetical protein